MSEETLESARITRRGFVAGCCAAACALAVGSSVVPAQLAEAAPAYGRVGYHCTKSHPSAGTLVVGDSRTCQLWDAKKTGASFVSVWGGHYGYGGSSYQIDASAQRKKMKEYISDAIAKKGRCDVYVFATVNDYDGGSGYKAAADKVASLAKALSSYGGKYKGKTVKCKVTVVGLVGSKGRSVAAYNKYLKGRLAKGVAWMSVSGCLAGANRGYLADNVHYNSKTLKNIWKKLT